MSGIHRYGVRAAGCIFLTLVVLTACEGAEQHHDHGEIDAFDEVRKEMLVVHENMTQSVVTSLIYIALRRAGLVERGIQCQCLVTDALSFLGASAADEETFGKLSVILVVFMRDLRTNCARSCTDISKRNVSYEHYMEKFTELSHNKDDDDDHHDHETHGEVKLTSLLYEIKKNYVEGQLPKDRTLPPLPPSISAELECFSAESLFHEMGIDEDKRIKGDHEIERLAGLIIYHIVKGHCVSPENVAPPHNFLVWSFRKYGENGSMHSEDLAKLMSDLKIGNKSDANGDGHEGHDHRRRKRSTGGITLGTKHHRDSYNVTQCYNSHELQGTYFSDPKHGVNPKEFETLCPALIQQIASGACNRTSKKPKRTSTDAEAYGYGTVAVFIITLCTLLGAPFFLFVTKDLKSYILSCLMALGVGTLCADAGLHLVPAALGLHVHLTSDINKGVMVASYVWVMFVCIMVMYVLYAFETIIYLVTGGRHNHVHGEPSQTMEMAVTEIGNGAVTESANGVLVHDDEKPVAGKKKISKISALAIMVIIGDSLHNFADGLAIGATFSHSVSSGIASSIAILFHELPHELSDFAVLMASGMSIQFAVLVNFLSGCTAFIGMFVGVAISQTDNHSTARYWIFIVAAGMFIYISLASIIPELKEYLRMSRNPVKMIVVQHIAILAGIAIMLVIAVMEPCATNSTNTTSATTYNGGIFHTRVPHYILREGSRARSSLRFKFVAKSNIKCKERDGGDW